MSAHIPFLVLPLFVRITVILHCVAILYRRLIAITITVREQLNTSRQVVEGLVKGNKEEGGNNETRTGDSQGNIIKWRMVCMAHLLPNAPSRVWWGRVCMSAWMKLHECMRINS